MVNESSTEWNLTAYRAQSVYMREIQDLLNVAEEQTGLVEFAARKAMCGGIDCGEPSRVSFHHGGCISRGPVTNVLAYISYLTRLYHKAYQCDCPQVRRLCLSYLRPELQHLQPMSIT